MRVLISLKERVPAISRKSGVERKELWVFFFLCFGLERKHMNEEMKVILDPLYRMGILKGGFTLLMSDWTAVGFPKLEVMASAVSRPWKLRSNHETDARTS